MAPRSRLTRLATGSRPFSHGHDGWAAGVAGRAGDDGGNGTAEVTGAATTDRPRPPRKAVSWESSRRSLAAPARTRASEPEITTVAAATRAAAPTRAPRWRLASFLLTFAS